MNRFKLGDKVKINGRVDIGVVTKVVIEPGEARYHYHIQVERVDEEGKVYELVFWYEEDELQEVKKENG